MALEIKKYDERPVRIEAVEITLDNLDEIAKWINATSHTITKQHLGIVSVTFESDRFVDRVNSLAFGPLHPPMYMVKRRNGTFHMMSKEDMKTLWKLVK